MKKEINFHPTGAMLDQIEIWLKIELHREGEGFYNNWKSICKAFDNSRVAILLLENTAIGFVTWSYDSDFTASIDIISIKSSERRKGYGNELVICLLEKFKESGYLCVDVECISPVSENFARQLDFIDFPKEVAQQHFDRDYIALYKTLTQTLPVALCTNSINTIDIWDDEPHAAKSKPPTWTWNIIIDNNAKLSLPIIHPICRDWQIRWTNEAGTSKTEKIKRFADERIFGKFIILDTLPND